MAFARFGLGSDVYVFENVGGYFECKGCVLQASNWVEDAEAPLGGYFEPVEPIITTKFVEAKGMIAHLELHLLDGHNLPNDLIRRFQVIAENEA